MGAMFYAEIPPKILAGGTSELELVFAEVTLSKITHAQSEWPW